MYVCGDILCRVSSEERTKYVLVCDTLNTGREFLFATQKNKEKFLRRFLLVAEVIIYEGYNFITASKGF